MLTALYCSREPRIREQVFAEEPKRGFAHAAMD